MAANKLEPLVPANQHEGEALRSFQRLYRAKLKGERWKPSDAMLEELWCRILACPPAGDYRQLRHQFTRMRFWLARFAAQAEERALQLDEPTPEEEVAAAIARLGSGAAR